MTRKGFWLGVLAFGLLKIPMAWRTSRKRSKPSTGSPEESVVALRAECRSLRTKNTKAVYLAIGLFRARARSVPPAAGANGEATVCGPAPSHLSQPPRRLGRG
jgi:hypothetical protein